MQRSDMSELGIAVINCFFFNYAFSGLCVLSLGFNTENVGREMELWTLYAITCAKWCKSHGCPRLLSWLLSEEWELVSVLSYYTLGALI